MNERKRKSKNLLCFYLCPYFLSIAELLVNYFVAICLMAKVKEIEWILSKEGTNSLYLLILIEH